MEDPKLSLGVLAERIAHVIQLLTDVSAQLASFKKEADDRYVTHREFAPVRSIVYAAVGLVLLGALGAGLDLIYRHSNL